jgi:Domain of unknown function (DUF4872)/Butirosin biosynthesis protein H, N-terminal
MPSRSSIRRAPFFPLLLDTICFLRHAPARPRDAAGAGLFTDAPMAMTIDDRVSLPMKRVSNFQHEPGHHCGSAAMRGLLRHVGVDLSEAMCFGLGSGLNFSYHKDVPDWGASHFLLGRTRTLERDLCVNLGLAFDHGTEDPADRAWRAARTWIDLDVPVLLNVELSRLPYYNSRTPFPGHRIVLVGYDEIRRTALIADSGFSDLQEVPQAVLRHARFVPSPSAYFALRNEWLTVRSAQRLTPLPDAVRIALRKNATAMLTGGEPHQGIRGMEWLANDFERWSIAPDWDWCARFAYQVMERRGTTGGLFRKMYAEYLREAEALLPSLRAAALGDTMEDISADWTACASLLKRISEEKDRTLFTDAGNAIGHLAVRERDFWSAVAPRYLS